MSAEVPNDPAHPMVWRLNLAPRCGARTRAGTPCRSPAVRGKRRCRMHGGAKGSGGQPGNRNAWKHGARSAEALALRRTVRELLREARELVEEVG
jgi:hypothetical protein